MNRPRQKKHLIGTLALLAVGIGIVVTLGIGLNIDQSIVPSSQMNKQAHPFDIAWIQGKEFAPEGASTERLQLKDFLGKPVIVNFWASWCPSCRQEAYELEKFWKKHGKEIPIVGVAFQDTPEAALKFARYYGKSYILGLDEDGQAPINYGVSGAPETFLIDAKGIIREKIVGPVTAEGLEKLLPKFASTQ